MGSDNICKNVSSVKDLFSNNSTETKLFVVSLPSEDKETYDYDCKNEGKESSKKNNSDNKGKKLLVEKLSKDHRS